MSLFELWLAGVGAVWLSVTLLWLLSLALKDASIIDSFWGPGYLVQAVVYFLLIDKGNETRQMLVLAVVALWSLRLGGYILWRNMGKGEDFRYQRWREKHGERWWWRSYLQVFILQGVLMTFIVFPILGAMNGGNADDNLTVIDMLALLIWIVGFAFEAGGDFQLAQFKANPANKGKVMDKGFWRYTRHPNYFGDATQWWAFYLFAVAAGAWWTIFSPIIMTFLLLRVSGVAMLEKDIADRRPQYKEYIEKTSAFIPMPPKKTA